LSNPKQAVEIICGAKLPNGLTCKKKPVEGKKRCAQHGGKSTGPKTQEGKLRSMRLKTGSEYSFLLKCSICPPAFKCDFYEKEREFCPLEAEILQEDVNVQAIREQRIKRNLIIIERVERIFLKSGDAKVLGHVEKCDSQLEHYLNAWEKISPVKGQSFVEKLSQKRREKEETKKG